MKSALKELEPESPIAQPNLMELSALDSFTAETLSKSESTKPVFNLSTINRLKAPTPPPPNEDDFGDFETAEPISVPFSSVPSAPIKTELTKQKTIDFAKVAQELEKQNDRENTFDLLADLDFSAAAAPPPPSETKLVDNAVNWDSTLEAKEL